ncbi:MAG: cell surface protein SprA [Bacteroidetes bacterium]|nr:cell surface protein SprA [Bacteroidota bacterium]
MKKLILHLPVIFVLSASFLAMGFIFKSDQEELYDKYLLFDAILYEMNIESLSAKNLNLTSDPASSETNQLSSIDGIYLPGLMNTAVPDTNDNEKEIQTDQDQNEIESHEGEFEIGSDSVFLSDSAFAVLDSAAILDSILKADTLALDSTARLKHFQHLRKDPITVPLFKKRKHSLFLAPPEASIVRTVKLDSTGKFVEIKETIDGKDYKTRLVIPLDDYIQLRLAYIDRKNWADLAYKYEAKLGKKELADIFASITNIDIPIPSNPVLSIFGPPKINLRISGAVDIRGAWRNESTEGITASRLGNVRNEPDFKQDVQINISGTIGDKLNITADWNTQNTFEYENQLKIRYTGYADEIVQSVEAGNVSLQTSPLVGGGEALFGIKSRFQFGPLMLTAIASQKKGEIKEKSLSGGAEGQTFQKRVYDYSTTHYFLDSVYADTSRDLNIFNKYYGNATPLENPFYRVKDIEVWKTVTGIVNPKERLVNAYIDLPSRSKTAKYPASLRGEVSVTPGRNEAGRFIKLEPSEYIVHEATGYISFRTQINETDAIAVAYIIEGESGADNDVHFGEFVRETLDTAKVILKLIKPQNLQPQFRTAWKLQLRNIYPLGVRDIKEDGFEFDIKYGIILEDAKNDIGGVKFLNAFGLDLIDDSKNARPDGKFDFLPGKTINLATGEIIFPVLQPFGRNLPSSLSDTLAYLKVYDTLSVFAKQDREKDKFILIGQSKGSSRNSYNLGFNIVEGSVRVKLGGGDLKPNVDYIMDYNTGQLIIRNEQALLPSADLRITYEENTLFQLAAKSLIGLRGEVKFSNKTFLGFSMLNLNQQTLSDKVRIGEEPLQNSIYGIDAQTSADLPFLTKLLSNVISTREMSSFSWRGEAAYINPDPNTKKSAIVSDNSESVAYIDDFEGSKQTLSVGVHYTGWKNLSPPKTIQRLGDIPDSTKMNFKAKTYWYNELPSNVSVKEIWPQKSVARGEDQVTVLDLIYSPNTRGEFSYNPDLSVRENNWGGMMKLLSSTTSNLVEQNIEYIEFWIRPDRVSSDGKMYIDLGRISEDVIPNNKLDTEDKNLNDLIDEGEDVGLDGLTNAQEIARWPTLGPDPSGDNFSFSLASKTYSQINGTEGNAALTDAGRFPDTEDLNRNGVLDGVNSYYTYEVKLDTSRITNPYVVGGGSGTRWYQFRIPLKDFAHKEGEPSFTLIENIRVWFNGFKDSVHIRLAEFNLVGNQWQKMIKDDSILNLSVVNIEDNSPFYYSPPDVQREQDRTQQTSTEDRIYKNEQSLAMILDGLKEGSSSYAVKYLFRPIDVFNYSEMKFYYHGERAMMGAELVFRFGVDTNNYYEYREPIRNDWQNIRIKFGEITAIKQRRDTIGKIITVPVDGGPPNSFYTVKGNPSLTAVSVFMIGVHFPAADPPGTSTNDLSGQIWVNELRLIGADDREGWAYATNVSLKLADFINFSANLNETNPFFHPLEQRFGSRVASRNWGISTDIDLVKLFPAEMRQSSLRFSYSHTENVGKPIYIPGTDIQVEEAAKQVYEKLINEGEDERVAQAEADALKTTAQTVGTSDTYSLPSIRIKIPTDFWLIRDTWNNLGFAFNYNKTFSRNPLTLSNTTWVWNFTTNYSYTFSPENYFSAVDIPFIGTVFELLTDLKNLRFYYSPATISSDLTATRNRGENVTRTDPNRPNITRDFRTSRRFQFGWKLTEGGFLNPSFNYSIDFGSSLAHLETRIDSVPSSIAGKDSVFEIQRSEKEIWGDILGGNLFGRDNSFNQRIELRTQPKLPSLFDLDKFLNITMGYSVDYRWQNDFRQAELGRSASFANTITFGMNFRLKQLFDPLFKESTDQIQQQQPQKPDPRSRDRGRKRIQEKDEEGTDQDTSQVVDEPMDEIPKQSPVTSVLLMLKSISKWLFFDYENISINFSQGNTSANSGLAGEGTGITNMWNFWRPNKEANGPSRLYQFGLDFKAGPRARGGNLTDAIGQRNNLDFRTSRPLWEGARIDLTWKVGWAYNKNTSIQSDSLGNVSVINFASTGTIDRSFVTLPPVLIFSFFGNGIKKVHELYDPEVENPTENLANAFVDGFETFPLLGKLPGLKEFIRYIPRPNWSLSWDGLEKFFLFSSFAQRVSLNHAYTSSYSRGWKINPDGNEETQAQKISYGFQPFLGLSMTFLPLWGGNLGANVKFGSNVSYDLGLSTKNITESFQNDINVSINFSKSGFELPLFGIALKNDIDISISYTQMKNSTVIYDMLKFKEEGTPQDGTTRTTIEPRIKYVMSSRVTLSIFYKRSSVTPEGASRIPPTKTNEAGLDVHITI